MQGYAYHWPNLSEAQSDGAYHPETGWNPALTPVKPHGWITPPELGPPDPETGEAPVIKAGVRPDPVMAFCPLEISALAHRRITPEGVAGLAGAPLE